ncbi:retron system putative HNH endonuclease [Hallella faecis]|uniref:Retron system putative HNH endonuclease n=1 Tax=Hallella faecis TaxID=2841596 RepID=A0ABV1FTB1_9BACT|nr:retron system putative HNH endonuclease [Hallella faecis]MBU0290878.1 TIGR02646 family protein [Hallella faecis]
MRYIEKHFDTDAVVSHEQELANLHLNEESLRRPEVHPGRTGGQLYETVRNMPTMHALKEQMYAEQGGVCCYCGMNLDYPFNPQYRVEHVLPKESHREWVGEYKNLLLSCRASREEMNLRNCASTRSERKKLIHCDEAKGSQEITYSPLDKACEHAFWYDLEGCVHHSNDDAKRDVITLGLAGKYLTDRRRAAIDSLIMADGVLTDDDLMAYREGLKKPNADGKYAEFYFVLIDAINQLLPGD